MKSYTVDRTTYDPVDRRLVALGAVGVIAGSAAGAALYTIEPRALLLVAALIAGASALWAVVYMPGVLFALFVCTPFFKAGLQPYIPIDITVVLALLNTLQIPILYFSRDKVRRLLSSPAARTFLFVWVGMTLTVVIGAERAPDPEIGRLAARTWVALTFVPSFAAIRLATNRQYMAQFFWGLFLVGTAIVLAGLWILPTLGAWPNDRLRVFGAHTIRVGQGALLVTMVAFPFIVRSGTPVQKLACMFLVPASLLVAASSGSRGPMLMLAVTAIIMSLQRFTVWTRRLKSRPPRIRPLRLVVPLVIALGLLIAPLGAVADLLPESSVERLGTLTTILASLGDSSDLTNEAPDRSTADRVIAWEFAQEMFRDAPVLGKGTHSFATEVYLHEARLIWPIATAHPHNLALQTAAEQGAVGLVILGVLLTVAMVRGFRQTTSVEWMAVTSLCTFYLLCSMVSTDMLDNRMLWCLLLLLAVSPHPRSAQINGSALSNQPIESILESRESSQSAQSYWRRL